MSIEFYIDPSVTEKSVREASKVVGFYAKPTGALRLYRVMSKIQTEPRHGHDQPGVVECLQWQQLWHGEFGEVWLPIPVVLA